MVVPLILLIVFLGLYVGIRMIRREAGVLSLELVEETSRNRAQMEQLRSGEWLRFENGEDTTAFAPEDVFSTYGGRKAVLVAPDSLFIVLVMRLADDGLIYKVVDCVDVIRSEILAEDGSVAADTVADGEEDSVIKVVRLDDDSATPRGGLLGRLGVGFSKFGSGDEASASREPATTVRIITTEADNPEFSIDVGSTPKALRLYNELVVVIKRGEAQQERATGESVAGTRPKPVVVPSRTTAWRPVPGLHAPHLRS